MKLNNIVLCILILIILGCGIYAPGTYIYKPIDNITYTLHTKELKFHSDVNAVFLNCELQIENKSNDEVFLNIGEIQANLNGVVNSATYYDSLASVMPEKEILKVGLTDYKLYMVFPESLRAARIKDFKITNFGLSMQ